MNYGVRPDMNGVWPTPMDTLQTDDWRAGGSCDMMSKGKAGVLLRECVEIVMSSSPLFRTHGTHNTNMLKLTKWKNVKYGASM